MTRTAGRWPGAGDDRGMTIVELTVAMTIMSVFLALFSQGLYQVFRAYNHDQAASAALEQIHLAFERLDTDIRYASGISAEAQVGSDWYVEFVASYTGTPTCTELRFTSAGQLQLRQWPQGATPTAFSVLASGATAIHPFTRQPVVAGSGVDFQRLSVSLSASGGSAAISRDISVTFTAFNTSPTTESDAACVEGRSAP